MVTVLNETTVRPNGAATVIVFRGAVIVPDIGQAYFWTPTWQAWEQEADEDLTVGHYTDFADVDSLLKDLHSGGSGENS